MKKKLFALVMGTSLILAACGGNDDNAGEEANSGGATTADGSPAAKTYQNKCLSCHGENLEGGVGPKLSDVGSRLSKEDIENVIANGKGQMPAGILQGEEASQVAAWLSEKK